MFPVTFVCHPRILPGHLASAVISATVRDASKAQSIPVAVKYTLSSSYVVQSLYSYNCA